ncbi:hypothetical protein WICMUC_002090 [Wickerhamomyces mucosus]|uniref:Uncharacterized protein n=1 Tax=Wickerhamomyces mucosus TaxID=1378264 RepID=A0A9P8TEY0_9ASCO|nr:hypothetical protein WICMUC_002090 [Wickerhamomyces mucosus]
MSTSNTRIYHKILYVSQFLIDSNQIGKINDDLPHLLSKIGLKNDNLRVNFIEAVQLFNEDLRNSQINTSKDIKFIAQSSRKFIKINGLLAIIAIILKKFKKIDNYSIFKEFNLPLSLLISTTPVINIILNKLLKLSNSIQINSKLTILLASLINTSLTIPHLPLQFQLYASFYSFIYAAQAIKRHDVIIKPVKWVKNLLLAGSIAEIYYQFIEDRTHLPKFVSKILSLFFNDSLNLYYSGIIRDTKVIIDKSQSYSIVEVIKNYDKFEPKLIGKLFVSKTFKLLVITIGIKLIIKLYQDSKSKEQKITPIEIKNIILKSLKASFLINSSVFSTHFLSNSSKISSNLKRLIPFFSSGFVIPLLKSNAVNDYIFKIVLLIYYIRTIKRYNLDLKVLTNTGFVLLIALRNIYPDDEKLDKLVTNLLNII